MIDVISYSWLYPLVQRCHRHQRIRGFRDNALYKSTFYFLTYYSVALPVKHWICCCCDDAAVDIFLCTELVLYAYLSCWVWNFFLHLLSVNCMFELMLCVAWWHSGRALDLRSIAHSFESESPCSRVQPMDMLTDKSSSIIWYLPMGGDALLGR